VLHLIAALLPLAVLPLSQHPPIPTPAPPPTIPADTEVVTTASGLKYSVLNKSTNTTHPKKNDVVRMHYTIWLADGKFIQSSRTGGQPFTFTLGGGSVIKGWDEGCALMSPGDRFKLTVPPALGWGEQPYGDIPANSTVVFDVEMLDFRSMPEFKPGNKEAQKKTESGLTYEVVKPATGDAAAAGDVLSLKFAFWNHDGQLQACTEREGQDRPLTGPLDKMPLPVFKEGAKLLHVGERLRIEAPAKVAFGEQMQPGMPPDSLTIWELELVGIKKPLPVPPFAATPADKLQKTASGLGYEVIKEGTGKTPVLGKDVTLHCARWLADGKLVDSTFERAEPVTLRLGMVIKGWNEGLQLMTEGAIYKFTIPPELGYGKPGSPPDIPPDATLIVYVELLTVAE
jgi:FKBP-type peptidyl-prolyl cis-trans isomerase